MLGKQCGAWKPLAMYKGYVHPVNSVNFVMVFIAFSVLALENLKDLDC